MEPSDLLDNFNTYHLGFCTYCAEYVEEEIGQNFISENHLEGCVIGKNSTDK